MRTSYGLELDLYQSNKIIEKVQKSDTYAQQLYAALCSNIFIKDDIEWSCSWRHAGSIVAVLNEKGSYLDWYCSNLTNEEYVEESVITDEIKSDLLEIGWSIK